jgi:hypothetical protein
MEMGQETMKHLNEHISYPATGMEIKQACNMMSHVPEEERKMDMDMINDQKTYSSANDVMMDMKM